MGKMVQTLSFKNMLFTGVVMVLTLFPSDAHQEKHFLHYKFTVISKADTFPEFSAVSVCDDRRISHFSDEERVWIGAEDWTKAPPDPPDHRDWFIHQIRTLSDCTDSQCSELHVLQRIIGCELEKLPDGSVNLTVFDEYGFDGEDLISFNSDTEQWIDKSPKAKRTKEEWDRQTGRNQFLKRFLVNCTDWISTFKNTIMSSPDVDMFARKAPDDQNKLVLTCLATGFYPRDIQMEFITIYALYDTEPEDQTSSEIRPNDDQTFQMRTSVKIDSYNIGPYHCRVIHSRKTVFGHWDAPWICTLYPRPKLDAVMDTATAVLLAFALGGIACFICCCFCCINKKRRSDARRQMTNEEIINTTAVAYKPLDNTQANGHDESGNAVNHPGF
ncbi:patr class I histocompatibility antigen, B-2 alpha chain-like [Pseudorasbora parva]|uniref:patr class I histocompatibility antigen, B-2 alpha chain-like n=1 Tax=Pseudorasbora parva TaxID=51549 RepID=UPI00351E5FA0